MKEIIQNTLKQISTSIPSSNEEYKGDDGLMYCSICHEPKEVLIKNPITNIIDKFHCICACQSQKLKEYETEKFKEYLERQRLICFNETNMKQWNFEHDDQHNPELTKIMLAYVQQFDDFFTQGRGLLLYGGVGTGKTFFAACIANSLINLNRSVYMTTFSRLVNEIQSKSFEEKQLFIDAVNKYSLLVIDDLGTERDTDFMLEQLFNIIDSRYRSGRPLIVTTNLSMEDIKNPPDIRYARIYDRILERCFPIEVNGITRRRISFANSYHEIKQKLGIK